jgi:hypothetical protein
MALAAGRREAELDPALPPLAATPGPPIPLVGAAMIVITCAHCGKRQVLPLTMVDGMSRTVDSGRVVYRLTYTCWCGQPGSKIIKGPQVASI